MKISESYKTAIKNAFIHTIFSERSKGVILKTMQVKVHGSDTTTIIPPIDNIEVERVDDTHDKITFSFDDYSFEGIITWKCKEDSKSVVFLDII